ncbi:MAG: alpha/beta hydrolase family protein [Candidatus Hodarchaeota archaeon]
MIFTLAALNFNKFQSYRKCERIQFYSAGATLYANLYYPSRTLSFQEKKPLIIYCHGIGSQRDFDLRIPIEFTKRGFYVAALDYHGHGESGGTINDIDSSTNSPALAQDCTKLLEKLKSSSFFSDINTSQIGLIGHSLGGMVVLMNQALNPDFKATVAWAPLVNFTPPKFGLGWQGYEQYIPANLINATNSENLLIIMHVNDEALNYSEQALLAKKLTNCTVINVTRPLIGGGHQLFSNQVLLDSIQYFEIQFFNSESINGPITITYIWNYVLIFLNLGLLISIILLLISYSSKFFRLNSKSSNPVIKNENKRFPKTRKIGKIVLILFFSSIFILNWQLFASIFGLIGVFFASLLFSLFYLIIKIIKYFIGFKKKKVESKLKEIINHIKNELDIKILIYSIICAWYFIVIYLIFSFFYPFAFIWPSNLIAIFISILFFPVYYSIEILFRKLIYPLLSFVKSEKAKAKLIIFYTFIIYGILMIFAQNFSYLPSVLFTFLILLIATAVNTIIYEHTKRFSAVILSSFNIIQVFFSAVISNVIGIGIVGHLF